MMDIAAAYETRPARTGQRLRRWRFQAAQGARVVWYGGHYWLFRRLYQTEIRRAPEPAVTDDSAGSAQGSIKDRRAGFESVFAADWHEIAAGHYPAPENFRLRDFPRTLRSSLMALRDARAVAQRRRREGATEIRALPEAAEFPPYYQQNFHYQSGGWLTPESARLYDTQVEILFVGAGDAMRRVALSALAEALRGRDHRGKKVLELACGTGRFLREVMRAFPRLDATGLDLSPAYVEKARNALAPWPRVQLLNAAAEAVPLPDDSQDVIVAIYLFHELPPKIRRAVFAEVRRLLRPGGVFILADSVQTGDSAAAEPLLDYFERNFHEPFFASWRKTDLAGLGEGAGLKLIGQQTRWLTKALSFQRPAETSVRARIART